MSDPSGELQVAVTAALRASNALKAVFGAGKPVKIYDSPPTNAKGPYLVVGEDDLNPDLAGCLDGAEIETTIHVWSQTDPPGKAQAKTMGAAVLAALAPTDADGDHVPPFQLPSHRVVAAFPVRASYLLDPTDAATAHGVLVVRFNTEPL